MLKEDTEYVSPTQILKHKTHANVVFLETDKKRESGPKQVLSIATLMAIIFSTKTFRDTKSSHTVVKVPQRVQAEGIMVFKSQMTI